MAESTPSGSAPAVVEPPAPADRDGSAVTVRVARSETAVAELGNAWRALGEGRATVAIDHLLTVCRTKPEVVRPHVLVLERGAAPALMLAGRLELVRLPCRIGYATVRAPALTAVTVVYGGLVGPDGLPIEPLLDTLDRSLREREADAVVFRELRVGSPLHRALLARTRRLGREVGRRGIHRELELPESFEGFLGSLSRSTRESARRYRRKVERRYGPGLSVDVYRSPDQLDRLVTALEAVASRSWQRGLGAGFQDDPVHLESLRLALEGGRYRACVISIEGRPVAFWDGEAVGGRLTVGIPGFDPAFAEDRIGTYALLSLIEALCADPDVRVLDFGFGDAEYKRRFASDSWEEETVTVFARRPRPLAVHLVRTSLSTTGETFRRAVERLGLGGVLKRAWRRRLVAPAETGRRGA